MLRLLTALAIVLVASAAGAAEPKFPALTGRVVDEANLLSKAQVQSLAALLKAHEEKTTNQVVVATVRSLQGLPIEDYGYRLGRHWGIGQTEKNNGALLLVAPQERKVRIEVGFGLEGVLTDALSKTIIESAIVPAFRSGDMAGGIVAGTEAIIGALEGREVVAPRRSVQDRVEDDPAGLAIDAVFLLVVLLIVGSSLFGFGRRGRRGRHPGGIYPVGYGRRGSGGFSGGGFSGGGGSFGGGGASGGW